MLGPDVHFFLYANTSYCTWPLASKGTFAMHCTGGGMHFFVRVLYHISQTDQLGQHLYSSYGLTGMPNMALEDVACSLDLTRAKIRYQVV